MGMNSAMSPNDDLGSAPRCGECSLGLPCVLTGAESEVVDCWDSAKRVLKIDRGEILFHEGQPSRGLYCVCSGRFKLYRTGIGGELQIVRLAGSRRILGHRSLFADERMSATAEAMQDCTVCFIDRRIVLDCVAKDAEIARNLLRILANELGNAEAQLLSVAHLNAIARLAHLLLEISDEKGVVCELTREEIGQIIGVTPESVSRSLHQLAREGAIALDKRRIRVIVAQRLQAYAVTSGPA